MIKTPQKQGAGQALPVDKAPRANPGLGLGEARKVMAGLLPRYGRMLKNLACS